VGNHKECSFRRKNEENEGIKRDSDLKTQDKSIFSHIHAIENAIGRVVTRLVGERR
jgi:hypothetical protein